jgi:hypothetical protein
VAPCPSLASVRGAPPPQPETSQSKSQQVEVFGRPVQATLPRHEQHGSFEDERVALPALSKPEEKSLDRIARQEGLKVLARLPAGIQEPRAD